MEGRERERGEEGQTETRMKVVREYDDLSSHPPPPKPQILASVHAPRSW